VHLFCARDGFCDAGLAGCEEGVGERLSLDWLAGHQALYMPILLYHCIRTVK